MGLVLLDSLATLVLAGLVVRAIATVVAMLVRMGLMMIMMMVKATDLVVRVRWPWSMCQGVHHW